MQTISINFQIPASWSELSDKQLRKVYELISSDYEVSVPESISYHPHQLYADQKR